MRGDIREKAPKKSERVAAASVKLEQSYRELVTNVQPNVAVELMSKQFGVNRDMIGKFIDSRRKTYIREILGYWNMRKDISQEYREKQVEERFKELDKTFPSVV